MVPSNLKLLDTEVVVVVAVAAAVVVVMQWKQPLLELCPTVDLHCESESAKASVLHCYYSCHCLQGHY